MEKNTVAIKALCIKQNGLKADMAKIVCEMRREGIIIYLKIQ